MRKGRSVPASSSATLRSIRRKDTWSGSGRSCLVTLSVDSARACARQARFARCRNVPSGKPPVSWASPPRRQRAGSFTPGSHCAKPASRKQIKPPGALVARPDRRAIRFRGILESYIGSTRTWSRRAFLLRLPLCNAGRELLEHFLHALVQVLDVLVRVVGESVARCASPKKFLGLRVEQIDDHCAYLVRFGRRRGLADSPAAESSPAPSSPEPVIKGIQGLLIARHLNRYDRNIPAGFHLL